jgi:SAM-dependent methyltransferase
LTKKPVAAAPASIENPRMSGLGNLVVVEARKILRNPSRLREVFRPRRWRQLLGVIRFCSRTGNRWSADTRGFERRVYGGYREYLAHQQDKLQNLQLTRYEDHYQRLLSERLAGSSRLKPGAMALCLGARRGAEVRAFRNRGCAAIGLDLNPGGENPDVVRGDFHAVPFQRGSVDVVFTNSLDHVFEVERFIQEIRRVLKPAGLLIVEAIQGRAEGMAPDPYASFWWSRVDDVVALFEASGFSLCHRKSFTEPWPGEQLGFEMAPTEKQLESPRAKPG